MSTTQLEVYVNVACDHKVANHAHGTRACYVLDKCRCGLCRIASSSNERMRRELKAQARWGFREAVYVDATAAVAHVRAIMAAGLGWKEVARRAGLNPSVVNALLYGDPDRNGGQPRTRCRPATRDALLAVPIPTIEDLLPGSRVPCEPTRNRIQALARMGYSVQHIATRAGLDPQRLYRALDGAESTSLATHNAVRDAFNALWKAACTDQRWQFKGGATRAARTAIANSWPSPLDLDDDGYRLPDVDLPATSRGADLDEWARLVRYGEQPDRAAQRCGVTLKSIERQAYRTERPDIVALVHPDAHAARVKEAV